MASLRTAVLRQLTASPLRATRAINQRRWAQVHDVRFLATTRPSQAIVDKYRAKLDQKAKQEGVSSIDELKAVYAKKIDAERRHGAVDEHFIPQAPDTPVSQPNADGVPISNTHPKTTKPLPTGADKPAVKTLDDIIDLEKSRELPDKELTAIWRLRHASDPQTLCAVMSTSTYKAMEDVARSSPQFVLPVPHPTQGAEIHFLQWTFDAASKTSTVLFTQLAEFKTRGEFAQPHTTITHHLDLADRGLILMQGQVVDNRGVKAEEAKWLVMCLQRFYGGWEGEGVELEGERKERADERKKLLEWFSTGDERFSLEKLMEEAERMG
ncbi:ATP11 protein-domain-containing protein [Thelonectria olida]|uniref:ATP11 protein-domain-containing protein n=1 Tax=Thelonectria olida TaxID=1576542 RepID=A0A9P9AQL1_9HYPO|nr:ATP11 protein-domain-containing protein [Thelonectria olida]